MIGNSIEALLVVGIMPEKLAGGIVAVKVKFPLAGFWDEAVRWFLSGTITRNDSVVTSFLETPLNKSWLYQNDSLFYNYTISFDTNFLYFPNDTTISTFDSDITVTFTPTGLPTWNYSLNTSHQTDFRNYTLLETISNITLVQLSYPSLNITLQTYENLSSLNLLEGFYLTDEGFVLDLPGTWEVSYESLLENPTIFRDESSFSFNRSGLLFVGNITSGEYSFVPPYEFTVFAPSAVVFNRSFSIDITYVNVTSQEDFSSSCETYVDGLSVSNVSDIRITTPGFVSYNVTCTGIDFAFTSGFIFVSDKMFFDWSEEIGRFWVSANFPLWSYSIIKTNSFFSIIDLNNSFNLFSNNQSKKINLISTQNHFYFKGRLFNNENEKEIVN